MFVNILENSHSFMYKYILQSTQIKRFYDFSRFEKNF